MNRKDCKTREGKTQAKSLFSRLVWTPNVGRYTPVPPVSPAASRTVRFNYVQSLQYPPEQVIFFLQNHDCSMGWFLAKCREDPFTKRKWHAYVLTWKWLAWRSISQHDKNGVQKPAPYRDYNHILLRTCHSDTTQFSECWSSIWIVPGRNMISMDSLENLSCQNFPRCVRIYSI